jgi:hypothetical protein
MSVILYPLLPSLGELAFGVRFLFFAGLMFFYTHLACAAPCSDNIEGLIYLKERYINRTLFLKFHFEMIVYSVVFGLLVSIFLF